MKGKAEPGEQSRRPLSRAWFAALATACAMPVAAQDFSGELGLEGQVFLADERVPRQHDSNLSIFLRPELFAESADGKHTLLIAPFARLDSGDPERTHFDLREAVWTMVGGDWELRAGVSKVFWGVAESNHLVDIVNQTDFIENIDGEDKVGQPMLRFDWIQDWGTLGLFALPYFRERTFAGKTGRPSYIPYVDDDLAEYDAGAEETHVDWAARYSNTFGNVDLGVAYFYGNNREPRYQPVLRGASDVALRPYYDLIHQLSIDVQRTKDAWLWKLEALHRWDMGEDFFAVVGGVEYTFYGVGEDGWDVGLVAEYSFDERQDRLPAIRATDIPALIAGGAVFPPQLPLFSQVPFDDDVMVGVRLAMNDEASTQALLAAIVDREDGTTLFSLEASRRLTDSLSIEVQGRFFGWVADHNPMWFFEKDDYLQIQLSYFF